MEKLYVYDTKRGIIHIRGCCQYSRGPRENDFKEPRFKQFDSEEEAEKYLRGRFLSSLCKLCRKERDFVVKNEKIYKKKKRR